MFAIILPGQDLGCRFGGASAVGRKAASQTEGHGASVRPLGWPAARAPEAVPGGCAIRVRGGGGAWGL